MRELTKRDVHRLLDEFHEHTVSGTFGASKSPGGKYFVWVERVVKIGEMQDEAATLFQRLMEITGAHRLEAICNERTGEPDRVKVSVTP